MCSDQLANAFVARMKKSGELYGNLSYQELYFLDYDRQPVDIIKFVESDYYFGRHTSKLSVVWKDVLSEVFAPDSQISTLILTGPIGNGKTTVATIAMGYTIYQLTCLKDPANFYELLPGSRIMLGCFNITLKKSDVGYDMLKGWIDGSPYFQKDCKRKKRPDEPIEFPSKNVRYDVGSLAEHALGENMFGFMMDEANFFKKAQDPNEKSRAHKLFNNARTRLVQRFQMHGRIPGIIVLISSKQRESSFLEEQLELIRGDADYAKTVKIASPSVWQVRPDRFSGDMFRVAIGDHRRPSRILEEDEIELDQRVTEMPVEYLVQTRDDIDRSLMDLAGIATTGSFKFFRNVPAMHECVDKNRWHPFGSDELSNISMDVKGTGPKSGANIIDQFDVRRMCSIVNSRWVPLLNTSAPRVAHIDLGLTHDCAGLAVGHVGFDENNMYKVVIDFMIRIRAKQGQEIDLGKIVDFFVDLRKHGYRFEMISFDQFQSRLAIQQLTKHGFRSGLLSIKLEPYELMRKLMLESRISYYKYLPLITEATALREGDFGKRPNHPEGGSDDVCDAVAGVVHHCSGLQEPKKENRHLRGAFGTAPLLVVGDHMV